MKDLQEYTNYKDFLVETVTSRGRGFRSQLASAIGCQSGYITHVLSGDAHLSLEQAEAAARFIGLSEDDKEYFLTLVEFTRAGTPPLRQHFEQRLKLLRDRHFTVKHRIGVKETLSREDQATYYSAWYYSAIHVALTIPELRSIDALTRHFEIAPAVVGRVLEFLVSVGLARRNEKDSGGFLVGTSAIHLESDSPLRSKHHTNWRIKTIQSFEREQPLDLHHSSVFTITEADAQRIHAMLVSEIESVVKIVKDAKEEKVFSLSVDFIEV